MDGRRWPAAKASGSTPPQARRDVQRLRAQSHAILTSSATVLADDPPDGALGGVRCLYAGVLPAGKSAPAGAVIDSQNRVTPGIVLQQPGRNVDRAYLKIAARGPDAVVLSACRRTTDI
ncbi:dihydrofolate reductase family protein [Salmonella enterica subsp. enterica]|nr:dihydrofolate reductase family protein [Salmonella enterica subsp. enterica]